MIWLCDHVWSQTHTDLTIILQVFQKLTRPPGSGEAAQAMHATVMSIIHPKLATHLRMIQKRVDDKLAAVIDHLLQSIKRFADFTVVPLTSGVHGALDFLATAPGNSEKSIKNIVQNLTVWSVTTSQSTALGNTVAPAQPPPTQYSPRVMQLATRLMNPFEALTAIVDEVKLHTDPSAVSMALDVATALICAPTAKNSALPLGWSTSVIPAPLQSKNQLNLRDALNVIYADAAALMKKDVPAAETVVRLHRRVELLCAGAVNISAHDAAAAAMGNDAAVAAAVDAVAAAAVAGAGDATDPTSAVDTLGMPDLTDQMGLDVTSAVDPLASLLDQGPGSAVTAGGGVGDASSLFDMGDASAGGMGDLDLNMDDMMGDGNNGGEDIFANLDIDGTEFNFD